MVKESNILIAGVGGQGVILMSELLGNAAVSDGLNVRGSEVLGMAVRGGPVVSIIRIGSEVYGPLIPTGKCDILAALEPAEALRNASYLSQSSLVIVNTRKIIPPAVFIGLSKYPSLEEIIEKLNTISSKVIALNATQIAIEAGNPLTANIVMLGALFSSGQVPIKIETAKGAIQERFPEKRVPVNLKAFDLGYEACQQALK